MTSSFNLNLQRRSLTSSQITLRGAFFEMLTGKSLIHYRIQDVGVPVKTLAYEYAIPSTTSSLLYHLGVSYNVLTWSSFHRNPLLMVVFLNALKPGCVEDKYMNVPSEANTLHLDHSFQGNAFRGCRAAFQVAENDLHIPHLIEPGDFCGVEDVQCFSIS